MQRKLKDIATIQSGYSFRARLNRSSTGNVTVIQTGDLESHLKSSDLARIELPLHKLKRYLRQNDIVFCPRGETYQAILVEDNIQLAIVAAPLLYIHVTEANILPAYVCWFINHEKTQAWLSSQAKGSAIRMIDKATIENLEITVLPRDKQHSISSLFNLAKREKELSEKIFALNQIYWQENAMKVVANHLKG